MALPQYPKMSRWLPWLQGGGLFVAISLGLHWAVLQIPIAEEAAVEEHDPGGFLLQEYRLKPLMWFGCQLHRQNQNPPAKSNSISGRSTPAIPQTAQGSCQDGPAPNCPNLNPPHPPEPVSQPSPEPELAPEPDLAPDPSPTPTPEPSPEPTPMTLDDSVATFAEYQPNRRGKSLATETNEFMDWYLSQTWEGFENPPLPSPKNLAALVVEYPLNQCLTPAPTDGQLEVIVNDDGTLARRAQRSWAVLAMMWLG